MAFDYAQAERTVGASDILRCEKAACLRHRITL